MRAARRGTLRLLLLLMVGSLLVPAGLFVYMAVITYAGTHRLADDRIVRALDVLHEHAEKVLISGNLVMDDLVEEVGGLTADEIRQREPQLQARLKRMAELLPQVQSIWIIDAHGYPLVTSYFSPAPRNASLGDRDFFTAQVEQDRGTFIGAVSAPRLVHGPTFFSLSRRLATPDGAFNGVVTVSMLPSDFEKFYADLARGSGNFFAMILDDGSYLARYPVSAAPGTRLQRGTAPLFAEIAARPQRGIFTTVSLLDGVERRYGYRRLDGFPIFVLAGVDTASIRYEWLAGLGSHLIFGLPATLLLFIVIGVARRRTAGLYAEADRREAAETALRHMQKLEAIGRLTGGVAHDFNNLLMVISGSANRLRRQAAGEKESRLIEMIRTAAKRGETLTAQLLSFSRQQALNPQAIDLARRIPELSELIRRTLADDVEVVIEAPAVPCPVRVDLGEFEVAMINICVNARDAMPSGGKLTIAVQPVTLHGTDAVEDLAGEFVAVSFTDTGVGIPPDTLPRVFEPFFTTKESAKGTGLGLSQVYGFAKQAGGTAVIRSEVGQGTTVTLYLPRGELAPATVERAPEPVAAAPARRTILVVEDNLPVAEVCRSYLDQLGYTVEFASSPRDGLLFLQKRGSVDIVLSDILMPGGMSGLDFARELRTSHPSMPIVLMTGFSNSADEVAADGFPVLRKPFDVAALQRELNAALAKAAS